MKQKIFSNSLSLKFKTEIEKKFKSSFSFIKLNRINSLHLFLKTFKKHAIYFNENIIKK